MQTIAAYTAEENGGGFEFWMPDKECRDYTLSYCDNGSVFCSQKCSKQVPEGGSEENNNTMLQIYPVLKNKSGFVPHRFKPKGGGAGGGGGTLAGKDSKHESVSSDLSRLGLIRKKPDSGFRERDDADDDLHFGFISDSTTTDQSFAWVRHTIISHYLGHCLKSMKIPVVQHIGGYGVSYSKTPDLKLSENGEAPGMYRYLGMPLMEVFSVVINNNNQGCVLSLYGTISTFDGNTTDCIYKRTREDSESISFSPSGDTTSASLTLTGPSGPIFVADSLWISLDLMVKKDTNDDDDIFYKGKMYWNYFTAVIEICDDDEKGDFTSVKVFKRRPNGAFGKPLATTFNGRSGGSVTINYAMLLEGEWADVEITLLNMHGGGGDGAAAAHVYGLIQAGSNCEGVAYWSVLLQKKKENDEYIGVHPGQLIPLSRSFVAVNGFSSLKVSVELYHRLRDTDLSQDDDEIVVKGIVDFPAQLSGMSVENISGCYGEIQVKVTWNC